MINKDIPSFSPDDYRNLYTSVHTLLGTSSKGSFRLEENTSVGLQIGDNWSTALGITLLERTPARTVSGSNLYPYKRLLVSTNSLMTPQFTESIGAQERNKKGILVDFTDGSNPPPIETYRRGRRKDMRTVNGIVSASIDLEPYIEALETIGKEDKEDPYGRTIPEQDEEHEGVQEFEEFTRRLLEPAKVQALQRQSTFIRIFGARHSRGASELPLEKFYKLPDDTGTLYVKEEKKGLGRKERVVYLIPSEPYVPSQLYKVRKADDRLVTTSYLYTDKMGSTKGKKFTPVDAVDRRVIIDILKSFS